MRFGLISKGQDRRSAAAARQKKMQRECERAARDEVRTGQMSEREELGEKVSTGGEKRAPPGVREVPPAMTHLRAGWDTRCAHNNTRNSARGNEASAGGCAPANRWLWVTRRRQLYWFRKTGTKCACRRVLYAFNLRRVISAFIEAGASQNSDRVG